MENKPKHLFDPIMGKFHLPKDPSDSIFGILKIDDNEGLIFLETLGYFENSLTSFKLNYQEEEKLLIGQLAHEQLGVLFKFRNTEMKSTNGVLSYIKLIPNFIAIGPNVRFIENQKYLFNTLSIRPQYFDEWSGRKGIKAIYAKDEFMPTYKISPKECITLLKSEDIHIYIIFRARASGMDSPVRSWFGRKYPNQDFYSISTSVVSIGSF